MKIGLLIIASEVLDGKITDSNTRYLANYLDGRQLKLHKSITVRDTEGEIQRGLSALLNECDLVVTSGGLGPTQDDLTKNALASFFGRTIEHSAEAEDVARENYERFGRTFPGKDHSYALLPKGALPLSNQAGMAPGLLFEHLGKYVLCAPGVPREFHAIMEDHLGHWIKNHYKQGACFENFTVRTKRVPEEKIFKELDPLLWERLAAIGEVCSLPLMMGVDIGIKIRGSNENELLEKKRAIRAIIEASPVSSSVWHYGNESLEEVIVKLAREKKASFAFAESATGGLCSHRITSVPGSSSCFLGSIVCYDTEVKKNILGVPEKTINDFGVVSVPTAEAMAKGALQAVNAKFAVSITGIAGPGGGTEETPVGTVCIGVADDQGSSAVSYRFFGDRRMLKERFAQVALVTLLERLEEIA